MTDLLRTTTFRWAVGKTHRRHKWSGNRRLCDPDAIDLQEAVRVDRFGSLGQHAILGASEVDV